MDNFKRSLNNKYERVMPRVYNRSRNSLKSSSFVTRHDTPSSVRIGGKPPVSNVSSGIFSELPVVLNDYKTDSSREEPKKRTLVVKPRKTLKSLDPALSPPRSKLRSQELIRKPGMRARNSATSVLNLRHNNCPESHLQQCNSSNTHSRLKEIKDELKAYQETDKLMRLRSRLYRSCGVLLDDTGQLAADKGVQVEPLDTDWIANTERSEQRPQREDAGATVLDEQMRSGAPRYPVDRYLVESSNKFEMVNIIDDEIWNTEPALRPEDEIILRKLHEMLQSTADDLKLLSGELSKYHEPGVQVKTAPTPLDEEFNEKVHIEELVNAKFHGYEIIEKPLKTPEVKLRNDTIDGKNVNRTKILNTDVKAKAAPVTKRPVINKKLAISRTRIMQIEGKDHNSSNKEVLNNGKIMNGAPAVAYNEFSFKYTEPNINNSSRKLLQVQDMPSINIRGELKEQKVLQLDIVPENKETKELNISKSNVSVVTITHETATKHVPDKVLESVHYPKTDVSNQKIRKISKLTTCESSESTNNVSSDTKAQQITQKRIVSTMRNSPKTSARNKKSANIKQESYKHSRFNIDEWKKKLNVVYGPSCSKKTKQGSKKASPKKSNLNQKQNVFNNAQYIPYSQLTLGGVRVSDIERELSNIPKNIDMPLSPILDKIISSRENSFYKDSSTKHQIKESPRILTTSDENLLQEVIDIERSVSETLSKNLKKKENEPVLETQNKLTGSDDESDENESYADDFEDEKSEHTGRPENAISVSPSESNEKYDKSQHEIRDVSSDNDNNGGIRNIVCGPSPGMKDKTFTKSFNLSYKDSVDIFEFIHSVDTQDIAIQSNETEKITPKETQTTPRNDKPNIQPIHNDLWPSIDPRREVEKMFELEKEFIKKLILDEYGDILEKSINKPSTSNENRIEESKRNIAAAQKNTQTSPAHVKSVMTSPKLTKTRTTSPFLLTVPVHQQTSPMIFVTNDNAQEQNPTHIVDIGTEADDISVNLSSPRFSLRLPQTSREVLSNLDHSRSQKKICLKREDKHINRTFTKPTKTSSSSAEADKSSSDMSSLGEIKIKRRLRKKVSSISEDSSSSTVSKYSHEMQSVGILPLRSEGEVSIGQARLELRKTSKSDGETSFGRSK